MNLTAMVIIAALVTALLVKSHKAAPALVSGVVTLVLLFAAFPTLGPAVSSSAGEFAHQLGGAADRAADVPDDGQQP
ncbi:hypothetical protein ACFPK1_29560 [Actinomycetospora rhizophila]|uniref:Uncharacterized protein n=1 Tax=Actinomycetospora rhizophila TaxID=1416876 RepID=A0ABV9ZQ80_9PSEU